jgi:hypothetical protein
MDDRLLVMRTDLVRWMHLRVSRYGLSLTRKRRPEPHPQAAATRAGHLPLLAWRNRTTDGYTESSTTTHKRGRLQERSLAAHWDPHKNTRAMCTCEASAPDRDAASRADDGVGAGAEGAELLGTPYVVAVTAGPCTAPQTQTIHHNLAGHPLLQGPKVYNAPTVSGCPDVAEVSRALEVAVSTATA